MATITLEYNARNNAAKKIIDVLFAMNDVFTIKTPVAKTNLNTTLKAVQDANNGDVISCESFDDYLKKTAKYA